MDNGGERIEWSFADYGSGAFHIVSAKRAPEPVRPLAKARSENDARSDPPAPHPGLLCRLAAALRFERCAAC